MKNKVKVKMIWAGYNGATNITYWNCKVMARTENGPYVFTVSTGKILDDYETGKVFDWNFYAPKSRSGIYKKVRKFFENYNFE